MDIRPGAFIVIEGSDGSGKKTQFQLLSARLLAAGYSVEEFDFPRYNETSSHFVRKYLAGEYGSADTINPYTASMFYALDRYEASFEIRSALSEGKIVLANRYVGSNMAHQGSKFGTEGEMRGFFMWEDSLEFQLLGLPRPDLNIFLKVPAEVSQRLIIERSKHTGVAMDEHEKDLGHLSRSVTSYELLCRLFPKDYSKIECTESGKIKSVEEISDLVWGSLQTILKNVEKGRSGPAVFNKNQLPAKEPAKTTEKTSFIVLRKTTALDRLTIYKFVGSNLFIEESGNQGFIFKTTPEAETVLKQHSKQRLVLEKRLIEFEEHFQTKLSAHKLSAKRTSSIRKQVLGSMQPRYCLVGLPEEVAKNVATPTSSTSQKLRSNITRLSSGLPVYQPQAGSEETVIKLISSQPRNELDLLAPLLFASNTTDAQVVNEELAGVEYSVRSQALKSALYGRNTYLGRPVLSTGQYLLQVNCSLFQIEQLLSLISPLSFISQTLSPLGGYAIPGILEDLGIAEEYSECFDASVALFSHIQEAHGEEMAALALLGGHRQRFLVGMDLKGVVELVAGMREFRGASGFLKGLVKDLVREIAEAQPLVGEFLTDLTRTKKTPKKD